MGSRGRLALAALGAALICAWALRPSVSAAAPADLVARLGYPDTALESYQRLERTTDPAQRAAIVAGLSHPDACVRVRCARLLAHQEDDVVGIDELEHRLDDSDPNVRSQVASTFMQLAPWERVSAIVRDPKQPYRARYALLEAMVADTLEPAEATLLEVVAARRDSPRLRVHATGLLKRYPSARQQAALARVADDASEPLDLRAAATRARGSGASAQVAAALAGLARDGAAPWRMREAAVLAMGYTRDAAFAPWLLDVARDPAQPSQMRDNAMVALGYLHTPEATAFLVTQLTSERALTRSKAAEGLAQARDPATAAAVEAALQVETDGYAECQMHAALCAVTRQTCPP